MDTVVATTALWVSGGHSCRRANHACALPKRPRGGINIRTKSEQHESGPSELHVADIHISRNQPPERRTADGLGIGGGLVRGLYRNGPGCRGGRFCAVTTWHGPWPCPVDSGPDVAPGNRTSASSGPWRKAIPSAAGKPAARRCADRGRGRTALQGACCGGGRGLGRSACTELYRNKASGIAGRGVGGALLAGAAWRHRRSECGAGPLADCVAAVRNQSGRCKGPRRSALAGGPVPVARQIARALGGAA